MATLENKTTGHSVTTNYAPEIVSLRAQGYTDVVAEKTVDAPAEKPTADVPDKQDATVAKPASKSTK